MIMRLATILLLFLAAPALAQTPGNCERGTAEVDLDISDVLARMFNTGSLFFGNTTVAGNGYLVPVETGHSPIFAAGIWVGGTIGGDLRVAGSTYDRFEFWPGPLNADGTLPNPDDCSDWDRFWVVDAYDLAYYEATGDATGDLLNWPFDLGAPVIDGDGVEGNYNLDGGDRPEVYGHQTIFWVMNDVGNVHEKNETLPIGLEVRVTAFSTIEVALDQQTFYRYELVNRNSEPFEAARFGLFVDPDLGDAADDYIGSDSTRSMAFVYNGSETDAIYGTPPAVGYDFLSGAGVSMYVAGCNCPTGDPMGGEDYYNYLRALWRDGTPLTEGGDGYMTGGDTLTWAFPGDPVTGQFWSEVEENNAPGDRRNTISTEAFTLAPGESRTFDIAILFAQGEDNIDSVSELRAVSDAVQARYDAGDLFAPSPLEFPPAGTLAAPEILGPEDGTFIVSGEDVLLEWTEVPGADRYGVQFSTTPDFADAETGYVVGTSRAPRALETNEVTTVYWRVQGLAGIEQSLFSESRSYSIYRYEPEYFGENGERIVETANPAVEDVCADSPDDPGCNDPLVSAGNTVWLDANATDDYVLTNPDSDFDDLLPYIEFSGSEIVGSDDFEIRFTETCSEPGACLGVYASALPGGSDLIVSLSFEVWNVRDGLGESDDPSDDVRMIPLLRALEGTEPAAEWADVFPAEQEVIAGEDTLLLGVTQRVIGMMPDRPSGYDLFAAAAEGFGGPGAIYMPEEDGDAQVDTLANGEECRRQNYYVDFCYRDANVLFVGVIGGHDGLMLADLAGDGTTPPVGTTIRFVSNDPLFVDAEDDAPTAQPQALALEAAYPNPFRASATVGYRLTQPADVRLAVYDVLGRRVAVLAEGPAGAGEHRATFDAAGLASGVYLVVLEADGQRQSKKVLLLR
jgi:hypothetical protein